MRQPRKNQAIRRCIKACLEQIKNHKKSQPKEIELASFKDKGITESLQNDVGKKRTQKKIPSSTGKRARIGGFLRKSSKKG